jgi:2-methylisocitrate lyase-like PEP mutase family enzyme
MIKIVPKTRQELEEVPKRVQAPLHVGFISRKPMYEGLTALDLGKMGYKIITFPQLLYYTAIKAQLEALGILRETSSDQALAERMIDMDFYLQVVQSEKYQAWQKKFIKE